MRSKTFALTLATLLPLCVACAPREDAAPEAAAPAATGEPVAVASPDGAASTDAGAMSAVPDTTGMPATSPTAALAAGVAAGPVLASQETNWSNVVVEVTEFRRKGNTLTAKFRVRNQGGAAVEPDFFFSQMYVMDPAAGKKYEVLKDEAGTYIAGLRSGWKDRWYQTLQPGESAVVWMKFPAPPPEVRVVTLQIPNTPPFDDLAIQDS